MAKKRQGHSQPGVSKRQNAERLVEEGAGEGVEEGVDEILEAEDPEEGQDISPGALGGAMAPSCDIAPSRGSMR